MFRSMIALLLVGGAALTAGCEDKKSDTPPATPPATAPSATAPSATAPGATAPTAAAPSGATGSLKGTVAFTGKAPEAGQINRSADPVCARDKMKSEDVIVNSNGTLKNVVVRLTNVTGNFDPPKETATITQEKCMYRPRVQAIVAGQTILVKNGDQTLHNVHTYKGTTTLFNQAQIPGSAPIEKKFTDASATIKFKCDVHPWMAGYVSVTNHPFFAVTGDDGAFEIKNIPAGSYKVEAWQEKYGAKMADVTVGPNAVAETKFTFDGTETATR